MLSVRWLLDPMHIEVNVAKNLMKHLYGINDKRSVRDDAELAGLLKASWITPAGDMPEAPWVLPDHTLKLMNGMICNMKFPSHYGAGFRRCTSGQDAGLPIGLKSHDYHKLIQHVLPAVLRACDDSLVCQPLRLAVYELCCIFRCITALISGPLTRLYVFVQQHVTFVGTS